MTQYVMSVIGPADYTTNPGFGAYASEQEMREAMAATGAFNERLRDDGSLIFVGGLAPASTSTVVDGRGSVPLFTDVPFLESKEHLNGLWIVEVADLDAALRLGAEASRVCRGRVEIRPFA